MRHHPYRAPEQLQTLGHAIRILEQLREDPKLTPCEQQAVAMLLDLHAGVTEEVAKVKHFLEGFE